ncbi:unnamed protein product [Malus baccata var. baccata]
MAMEDEARKLRNDTFKKIEDNEEFVAAWDIDMKVREFVAASISGVVNAFSPLFVEALWLERESFNLSNAVPIVEDAKSTMATIAGVSPSHVRRQANTIADRLTQYAFPHWLFLLLVAEPQVARLCAEAQECMVMDMGGSIWCPLCLLRLRLFGRRFLLIGLLDTQHSSPRDWHFGCVVGLLPANVQQEEDKVSFEMCLCGALDLDCVFAVICNVVTKSESPDEALEMAKLISSKIPQKPSDKPALRLKMYDTIFVQSVQPALNLAIHGKVTEHVIPSFKNVESFLKEWNMLCGSRQLFLTIVNVLKEHKKYAFLAKESFKFLTKYLATFSSEDVHTLSKAKEEAVRTIVEFVKASDMFQCDLLNMPAVEQLEKDAKHALAYQLMKFFLTKRLDACLEFQAANPDLLKSYGLVHEDCITKMRLISLMDLGSDESGRIPYGAIRDTLQINDDKVELWAVKAITAKLMYCKMDQMNQVVIVRLVCVSYLLRCTVRVFGEEQWLTLRTKLATWRGNIANVISTIQANRMVDDESQAVQGLENSLLLEIVMEHIPAPGDIS